MTGPPVGDPAPRARARARVALAVLAPFGLTVLTLLIVGSRSWAGAIEETPGPAVTPGSTPAVATDVLRARGEQLYLRGCVSCHAAGGSGTQDGPALLAAGAASADFFLRTGRMPLAAPAPQSPVKAAPYDDGEIKALVTYVASLCDKSKHACPAIPEVDPAAGSLAQGGDLFLANCAPCHNSVAIGGALSTGNVAPSLQSSAPQQVAEAVRIGPGQMPQFGPDVLSPQEVDSVVRYVEYLRQPDHPGGASLGYTGPVAEGFVALLLGLGAMFLGIRWITREPPGAPADPADLGHGEHP